MSALIKNILGVVAALFLTAILFTLLYQGRLDFKILSLNEVANKINSGEVVKITVREDDLELELKDKTRVFAKKETESGLTETLKNFGVNPEQLLQISFQIKDPSGFKFWASVLIPSLLPIIVMVAIFWWIFRQARTGVNQAFTFGRANSKLFSHLKDRIFFKDVAGLKEAKQDLEEVVDFLKNSKKFLEIGARIPRGVLLMGPPGTGKTLLARAVAGESNVPFFHISGSEFVEMFVGVGASRVRDLFTTAKKAAPSIVFIDEIDAVGRERGAGLGGGNDEREQTLNQILVEMDGFDRDTNIIVIAATNRPDILDSALLRPGRFDRRVVLDMPDIVAREEILKIHVKEKPLAKEIDLKKIAVRTPGFSGADLANLANEAAILTARLNQRLIQQGYFYDSIERVMLGPERRSRVISQQEKEITAYHEAGHALVAASLKNSDPIHKISIISRGLVGGYTLKLPLEEKHLRTKSQFLADLAVALGGYASELITFKDLTTGASNDLQHASELARRLITKYGMSEKLGPITFGKTQELIFLGREISTEKNYSEATAIQIDREVESFIKRTFDLAKKIINSRRFVLKAIADALIEKETLEQEEFYGIIKKFHLKQLAI